MRDTVRILLVGFLVIAPVLCAAADVAPKCLERDPSDTVEYVAAKAKLSPKELLARLVYAEALSTGFGDDPLVHEAIAWGVMNRVRLAEHSASSKRSYGSGIRGVVFKKGQFNPAVSPKSPLESRTSGSMLRGTSSAASSSSSQSPVRMSYMRVRAALDASVAWTFPPVRCQTSQVSTVPKASWPRSAAARAPSTLSSIHRTLVPEK